MSTTTNANAVVVRRANLKDIGALVLLRRHLLSTGSGHYAAHSDDEDLQWQHAYRAWLRRHIEEGTQRICVAVASDSAGEIVAGATGIIDDRAPMNGCLNGLMGWVQSVVVLPQRRRTGLGTDMLNFLLRWFEDNQVGKIALQTTPQARTLYQQLAFRPSGEDLLIRGATNFLKR